MPITSWEMMQLRQDYRNFWHTDLTDTIKADCLYCCLACCCAPCVSYQLRKRALHDDMSRYVCCAGYKHCSGRCGESYCPEFCLAAEVLCCFRNSVFSTRFLLQDEFSIQTTQCDNCINVFMLCLYRVRCACSIIALIVGSSELQEAAQLLSCLCNMVYCTVCACMQDDFEYETVTVFGMIEKGEEMHHLTQHKVEMDKRDGVFGPPAMAVPPFQQMSRLDQPYPSSVGYAPAYQPYPPAPAYGQPYGYPQGDPCAGMVSPIPPFQQMSRLDQAYPSPARYAQPAYGQAYPSPAGYAQPAYPSPAGYAQPAYGQAYRSPAGYAQPAYGQAYPQAQGYPQPAYPSSGDR